MATKKKVDEVEKIGSTGDDYQRLFVPNTETTSIKNGVYSAGNQTLDATNQSVTRTTTGRGTFFEVGERPPLTIDNNGVSTTHFDKLAPIGTLSPNVSLGDQLPQTQQQMLQQPTQQQLITQQIQDLFNQQQRQQTQVSQEQPKSIVEKTAELGLALPVGIANTINKGLGLFGVKLGEPVSTEEVASTEVGKILGLGVVAAGAGAGAYAASSLIPAVSAKMSYIAATRGITGAASINTGLATSAASSNLLKALFTPKGALIAGGTYLALGKGSSLINGRISDLQSAIGNQREAMSLINEGVRNGIISPTEANAMFTDMENDINKAERSIRMTSLISLKSWLGKGKETETNILKMQQAIALEKANLQNAAFAPYIAALQQSQRPQ
jgi:hypothetical protein